MAQGGKFEIEVPIKLKGEKIAAPSSGTSQSKEKTDKKSISSIENLRKSIIESIGVTRILGDIFGGVYKMISPLTKVLNVLFMVIFRPLMPIIMELAKGIAKLTKNIGEEGGGISGVVKGMEKTFEDAMGGTSSIKRILIAAGAAIVLALMIAFAPIIAIPAAIVTLIILAWDHIVFAFTEMWGDIKWLAGVIKQAFIDMWEDVKKGWQYLVDAGLWIWENILLPAWNFLKDVGSWIWEYILKPAFEFLKDVGSWIWDIISAPFRWLADKIRSIWSWFKKNDDNESKSSKKSGQDFILRPNGEMIQTSPSDTIFAMKNPEKLGMSSGNNISITINNPSVRNDGDIRKITEEVSKILERKLWRSY